jgi:dynein assembly factor 1
VLEKMPNLAVLYLQGNEVCKKIKNYRKTLITKIPTLKYLDDRPVFEEDRRFAEAFSRGGLDEERKEREILKKEKEDAHW